MKKRIIVLLLSLSLLIGIMPTHSKATSTKTDDTKTFGPSLPSTTPTTPTTTADPVTPPDDSNTVTDNISSWFDSLFPKVDNIDTETDNLNEKTNTSLTNDGALAEGQQALYQATVGTGGYSNTDVYTAINDINKKKKLIAEYMNMKYLTDKDLTNIKGAMYLSQFIEPLNGNLLNIAEKLLASESTGEIVLTDEISDGTSKTTLKEICTYIKENYYVTKLYVSDGKKGYTTATVKDLKNINDVGMIYLKDTTLLASDLEVTSETLQKNLTSEASTTTADGLVTVNGIQTGTALSRISDKDKTAWLPFLDKNVRIQTNSTSISNMSLNPVDTYVPILNNTLTTKAALTIQINDYLRYNPNFKMSNFNKAFGAKQLGMDSFGNLVCYDDGLLIMNVMMNPVLMSTGYYEKLNLTSYNIKCYYSTLGTSNIVPDSNGVYGVIAKKGVKIKGANKKWTTAIMDGKEYGKEQDAIFVMNLNANDNNMKFKDSTSGTKTNSLVKMGIAKLPSGEKTPTYHLSKISILYSIPLPLSKADLDIPAYIDNTMKVKVKTNDGTEEEVSITFESALLYTQGENAKDTRGAIDKWWNGSNIYESDGRFQWYYANLLNGKCLYTGDSNGYDTTSAFVDGEGNKYYQDFFGYRKRVFTFYADDTDTSKMYSAYGYITRNMTSNNGGTQTAVKLPNLKEITSHEIVEFTKMYMGTGILNSINIFKNWDKYKDFTLTYIKDTNTEAMLLDNTRVADSYIYPNDKLSTDDDIETIAMLGISIYGELYKDIPLKDSLLLTEGTDGVNSVMQPVDFNNLLMSIVKNTNQTSKRLDAMTEISAESAEEMKQAKVDDIISKVSDLLTNFVYTCQKIFGGWLQLAHIGMSSSSIKSLFYITGDDIQYWTSTLVQKLLWFSMIILVIKIVIGLIQLLLSKKYRIWDFVKMFYITVFLMTVPLIGLNLSIQVVGALSDGIMRLPVEKYSTLTLQQSLKNNIPKAIAADENVDKITEYFIEHFDKSYESSISIQELDVDKIEGFGEISEVVRKNLDLGTITTVISAIPSDNDDTTDMRYVYNGGEFATGLGDNYSKSVFYYFLDYYINLWCTLNGKTYEPVDNWQTQLQQDMFSTKSLEGYFSSRSVIYGDTAGMSNSSVKISDIFGLGTLFYDDGSSPSVRGYSLPIELMDTRLISDTFLGNITDNMYWYYALKDETMQSLTATQKSKLTPALSTAPVYAHNVLELIRTKIGTETVTPRIIGGADTFKKNRFKESEALDLETKLWVVNKNIYKRVCEYYDLSDESITDYTDIIQIAALSTFEFDKQFNTYGSVPWAEEELLQTSYVKEKMDFDMILKAIFKSDKQVTEDFDLMYEIVLDGFGILPAILLIVGEFTLMLYLTLRILHLGEIYVLGTLVCSLAYGWKSDTKNKAWVGIAFQCFYFIFTHIVVIGSIALITLAPIPKNNLARTTLAFILCIGGIIGTYLELKQMIFLLKNAKDLGGQVVADKVSASVAKIQGKLEGALHSDNVDLNSDNTESIENPNKSIEPQDEDSSDSSMLKGQQDYANRMRTDSEKELDAEAVPSFVPKQPTSEVYKNIFGDSDPSWYSEPPENNDIDSESDNNSNESTINSNESSNEEDISSYDNARDTNYEQSEDINGLGANSLQESPQSSNIDTYDHDEPIDSGNTQVNNSDEDGGNI